ncbi:MAG: hypothetical protein M3401_10910 [Actinomycetota bacterium]|nr:hypothetical protein [Actinomycetota bacterium]
MSGIWIREQGIQWAAQSPSGSAQPAARELHAAFLIILAHECFHAIVDRTPTHASSWLIAHHGTPVDAYATYKALPKTRAAGEPLEEALANAFALQQCVLSQLAGWITGILAMADRSSEPLLNEQRVGGSQCPRMATCSPPTF